MDILALDFDGVICKSAGEACASGWRAARRLWPDRFGAEVPDEILQRFERVRPVMEFGYQAILLVRLLRRGYSVKKIRRNAPALFSGLMQETGVSKDALVRIFGSTRDMWMKEDLPGWLGSHDFYDGTVDAVNGSDIPPYIITTKEKRFAVALCAAAGLRIPEEKIFGLESGRKLSVLTELCNRHKDARFHFIEDRISTLITVRDGSDFNVRLYWAAWGYHTRAERDLAEAAADINVLSLDRFPEFVHEPWDFIR